MRMEMGDRGVKYEPLAIYGRISVRREIIHTPERLMYSTPESPNVKHCAQCGGEFKPNQPFQKYCNQHCKYLAQQERKSPHVYVCKQCGKEYRAKKKDRNQFCSRECAYAFGHPEKRKEKPAPKPMPTCAVCGAQCKRRGAKTCSLECSAERARSESLRYSIETDARDRSARKCKHCQEVFVPEYGDKRKSFCSNGCRKKWSRRLRVGEKSLGARARKLLRKFYGDQWAEHYEPIIRRKIFERDGWRCQLCGSKIKQTKGWHPQQATIDHIIPLALGGEHKAANVQSCCMACNSSKSATIQGQQRLFG